MKNLVLPVLASSSLVLHCQSFTSPRRQLHKQTSSLVSSTKLSEAPTREGSLADATKKLGSVPYGETSRKYRRTVFRHKDWVEHRSSSSRIIDNLQSIFFSGVVRQLRPQVTAVTVVATVVLTWNYLVTTNTGLPTDSLHFTELSLPTLPFTLSSPALGLLLVFRTNAAYFRWMSGRDSWARMIVHCKNLVRMTSVFCTDVEAVEEFSKVVWLYCRSVMNKLSSPDEDELVYKEQVMRVFEASPIAQTIITSPDRVTSAWREMSVQLHSLPAADPKALIETDKSIIILGECTSICEKIYSSPVPLVYTRHTARYLSVWSLLLPCALYSSFSGAGAPWVVLPASAVIAFFLFGVDELAMQLEEPFSILPMQTFCDDIYESNKLLISNDDTNK
jgi:putative membrane protein